MTVSSLPWIFFDKNLPEKNHVEKSVFCLNAGLKPKCKGMVVLKEGLQTTYLDLRGKIGLSKDQDQKPDYANNNIEAIYANH